MTRAPIQLASGREDRAAADVADDLGLEQRVSAGQPKPATDEGGAHELEARRACFADVLVPGVERDRIERSETDQVVEVVGEVGQLDGSAIPGEPLLDPEVESARAFGGEVWIAEEAGRRAVRLDEQRLLDAAPRTCAQSSGSQVVMSRADQPRRRDGCSKIGSASLRLYPRHGFFLVRPQSRPSHHQVRRRVTIEHC